MYKDIRIGIRSVSESFRFIIKHKFYLYSVIPLILVGFVLVIGYYYESIQQESLENIENNSNFLSKIYNYIKYFFSGIISFLLTDFYKYLTFTVLSPFLAFLSEKTEEIISGRKYKFDFIQLLLDIKRGIIISIRMIIGEYILLLLWLIIAKILSTSKFTDEIAHIVISSYFFGFGFMDYVNERYRLTVKESWKFIKNHYYIAIIIGFVFSIIFYLPSKINTDIFWLEVLLNSLGLIIAPIIGVVSATLAMDKLIDFKTIMYEKNKD